MSAIEREICQKRQYKNLLILQDFSMTFAFFHLSMLGNVRNLLLIMLFLNTVISFRTIITQRNARASAALSRQYSSLISTTGNSNGDNRCITPEMMSGLVKRVKENNQMSKIFVFQYYYLPFKFNSVLYGYITRPFAARLGSYSDVFTLVRDDSDIVGVELSPEVCNMNLIDRSAAVGRVTKELKEQNVITGWRDELLPVSSSFSTDPILLLERAAAPFFGIKNYGVHINGYIKDPVTSEIFLWVAKRSPTKSTYPGMYDHIVAGGQPYGISPIENVIKECAEEASIPFDLAKLTKSTGAVSYTTVDKNQNLKRDTLFCYDIELPVSFMPTPMDGEVESFELQNLDWVLNKIVEGGDNGYKPNCNVVIIDFLIRHGVITSETPGYLELVSSLRNSECS